MFSNYKAIIKKRVIFIILIIYILLTPLTCYSENGILINNRENINYNSEFTFKYIKENQKILDNVPEIGCKAAYIAEPNTGKIIYEKNAHEKMYPASTTKILTALLAIEKCKLSDTATVSQNAIDLIPEGYSDAGLIVGEKHTIKTLLYALLLPSANEAANVIAEHISGTVEAFADLCNARAKELGCEQLHFVNPNGIHDDEHYCTAYDLYVIAKECRKHEIFNEIVKTTNFTIPATDVYPYSNRTYQNTNELIQLSSSDYYYPYCTGIKTGFTTPAGECLVASSSYNNIDLISVVLGGEEKNSYGLSDRFYDTKNLFEFVYNNYSIKKIAEYGNSVATISVGKATASTSTLDLLINSDISTIVPNNINKDNISSSISINENIVAPVKQNQVLGKITFDADGLIYTTNIVASHSVQKIPYELYYIIIGSVAAITLILFVVLFIVLKKYRKIIAIVGSIIIIIECICVFFIYMQLFKNSTTKYIPNSDISLIQEK